MNDLAAWLIAVTWLYTVFAMVLVAAGFLILGVTAYWLGRLTRWAFTRLRHRADRARMRNRPYLPPTRSPQGIDDYWTIRRAWHLATREEAKR